MTDDPGFRPETLSTYEPTPEEVAGTHPGADVLAEEYRGRYLWDELDKAKARIADLEEQFDAAQRWLRIALKIGEPKGHRISVDEDGLQHEGDCYWCDIRRFLAASNPATQVRGRESAVACNRESPPGAAPESAPASGGRVATGEPSRTSATAGASQSPEESSPATERE